MIDLGIELQPIVEADVLGIAVVEADRTIRQKMGRLVEWLPAVGTDCCQCLLLVGRESELAELAKGKQDMIALPGVRGAVNALVHSQSSRTGAARLYSQYPPSRTTFLPVCRAAAGTTANQ